MTIEEAKNLELLFNQTKEKNNEWVIKALDKTTHISENDDVITYWFDLYFHDWKVTKDKKTGEISEPIREE